MSIPKSSPATLVNLLITLEALIIAKRKSMIAVQMQTLPRATKRGAFIFMIPKAITGSGLIYFSATRVPSSPSQI
jgi:hypothetical protein